MKKENKIKRTLKFSFWDGFFASCTSGLTNDYITPYALALKISTRGIGMLTAVPFFVSSLTQLKSADITEKIKSRKKVIIIFVFIHMLMLIPIMFIPYMFKTNPTLFLILFVSLFVGLNTFVSPVWSALMSEYIPYNMRGKYFGWRNRILNIVTIVSAYAAGFILHYFKNNILKGFLIILTSAFICRFISWCFLTQMYEPHFKVSRDSYFSFFDFIRRIKKSNFAKFTIFVASLHFCVNMAAPYFAVFMLKELKFSYLVYTIVVTTVTISQILTFSRWGAIADKIGNVRVFRTASFIIASLPLWWIISQNPIYLVFIQILSGIAWAGFNLCTSNFIYDAVTPQKRVRCIAYFNVFTGMAVFLGASLGSYLVNILPIIFNYQLLSLFFISSLLRFVVVSFFYRRIQEVRVTEKIATKDLFYSLIGFKQILEMNYKRDMKK